MVTIELTSEQLALLAALLAYTSPDIAGRNELIDIVAQATMDWTQGVCVYHGGED